MDFRGSITPKNGKVEWVLKVHFAELMTPDRQVAKGVAKDGQSAHVAIDKARREYEERFGAK